MHIGVVKLNKPPESEPAKILWTGGWDSTFQLMQLLLSEKRRVDPYYLIDEDRPSTGIELLTMKRIRARVRELHEPADELLQSTKFFSVFDVPACPTIADAFEAVRQRWLIGGQYEWLARFCEHHGITGLQLCIHVDDKAAAVVRPLVPAVQHGHPRVLDAQSIGTSEHALFKYFEFPILELTKKDMARIAKERGWSQIMQMTWFCHNPRNGRPCGLCNPCRYTIDEGLAWRVPWPRRFVGKLYQYSVQPARELAKTALSKVKKAPPEPK
jgi:hypothetical protein